MLLKVQAIVYILDHINGRSENVKSGGEVDIIRSTGGSNVWTIVALDNEHMRMHKLLILERLRELIVNRP